MISRAINLVLFIALLGIAYIVWEGLGLMSDKTIASVPETEVEHKPTRDMELGTATKQKSKRIESKVIMNDPAMSQKWGLQKMQAKKAWDVSQGSKEIIIAVIDTGIDINHKDLKANLWVNTGETGIDPITKKDRSKDGIDNDRNGCIDDVHGCNFITGTGDLTDNHGHGTHIAGIIGAEGGNGFGISGVAPKISLMILKYYDPKASGVNNLKNTIRSIQYAVDKKAHIINYSGGGLEFSQEEFDAVQLAAQNKVLFVAAAGNERSNSDQAKYYPADYELSNIISVTAVDPKTQVLATSNYGVSTVDIAAPGQDIFSTLPGNSFGLMTGTSQATAFVSGVAALVMASNREYSAADVKRYILKTGDEYPWLRSKTGTSKKLNIYKALTTLDSGVSATGVIASNVHNMKSDQFVSDPNVKLQTGDAARDIANFGKMLMESMSNQKK